MECDYNGEMILPLPFSILSGVVTLGLLIARFMKNRTNFFVSVIAVNDTLLKANWFFLLIFLGIYKSWVALGLILYCFIVTFVINFLIWRKLFYKYNLENDP